MNTYMYYRIRDSVLKLHIYIVHTELFLVVDVVLDKQLRLIGKSTNDSVPLVMIMVMLIWLTGKWLKYLANQTKPTVRRNKQNHHLHISISVILRSEVIAWSGLCIIQLRFYQVLLCNNAIIKGEFGSTKKICIIKKGFCPSIWRALSGDMIQKAWPCATWLSVNWGSWLRVSQVNICLNQVLCTMRNDCAKHKVRTNHCGTNMVCKVG
jgi:hypothetical protein